MKKEAIAGVQRFFLCWGKAIAEKGLISNF